MLGLELIKERRAAISIRPGSANWTVRAGSDFKDHAPGDIDALIVQVEKNRYAMARALLYLRQTHDHDEWYNEEYVVAGPINLLINALGTKDIRAILELEKHDES